MFSMSEEKSIEKEIDERTLKMQKTLKGLIISVAPILVLTITFAWIFYPEQYRFFQDYVSRLGAYYSTNSLSNLTSSIIFTSGFGLCGAIFLVIMIIYFVRRDFDFNIMKGIFSFLMVIGAGLTGIPQDHSTLRILHGIGAACFIGGFGILNFTLQMMRFTRKHKPKNFVFNPFASFKIFVISDTRIQNEYNICANLLINFKICVKYIITY